MGADRRRAMGIGAAQRKIHARPNILSRPMRGAVNLHIFQRAGECAIGIAAPRPNMALIEMGMDVDEAGEEDTAAQIKSRQIAWRGMRRKDALDGATGNDERDVHKIIAAGKPLDFGHKRAWAPRIGKRETIILWNVEKTLPHDC